jgi:hypothetical protein
MRAMMMIAVVAAVSGCAEPAPEPPPMVLVTPSDQRATADIVPDFEADAASGTVHVVAMLDDRLDGSRSIELSSTEHLYAVIGSTRTPLVGELYLEPSSAHVLWARYTATVPVGDIRYLSIEFDRADGTTVSSTITMPAEFTISGLPANIKMGDMVTFQVAPSPGVWTYGYWDAWCDATPTDIISDGNYGEVSVSPDGKGTYQFGEQKPSDKNCAGTIRVRLGGSGVYDPAFAPTSSAPVGYQAVTSSAQLWGT